VGVGRKHRRTAEIGCDGNVRKQPRGGQKKAVKSRRVETERMRKTPSVRRRQRSLRQQVRIRGKAGHSVRTRVCGIRLRVCMRGARIGRRILSVGGKKYKKGGEGVSVGRDSSRPITKPVYSPVRFARGSLEDSKREGGRLIRPGMPGT